MAEERFALIKKKTERSLRRKAEGKEEEKTNEEMSGQEKRGKVKRGKRIIKSISETS